MMNTDQLYLDYYYYIIIIFIAEHHPIMQVVIFQPVGYVFVLLVFGLLSLGPGTQSLGLGL